MRDKYIEVLRSCDNCGGSNQVNQHSRGIWGYLQYPEVQSSWTESNLEEDWPDYYDKIHTKLVWSSEGEDHKDRLLDWAQWAWNNCHLTSYGRAGNGPNWHDLIATAAGAGTNYGPGWGYGIRATGGGSGGAATM